MNELERRLEAAKDNAVLQAQIWAQEARTQRGTVLDILRYFGLPERDWEAVRLIQGKVEAVAAEWDGCHHDEPGGDTYIVMSKGHHDAHAFMAAVREAGYDWPLGHPQQKWVKATPCPPSCGEHTCHYTIADEQKPGWFPATYAHETDAANLYKPPNADGVPSHVETSYNGGNSDGL